MKQGIVCYLYAVDLEILLKYCLPVRKSFPCIDKVSPEEMKSNIL